MIGRLLVAAALVFAAQAARADERAEARRQFQAGTKHYKAGEYREALEAFRKGYAAKSDPVFLFNTGQCHRQLGEPEGAAREYRAFLRERPDAPNRVEVEGFIAAADEQVAAKARDAEEKRAKENPAPAPSVAVVEAAPAPPPKRGWIVPLVLVGAAVVVIGVVVTLVALFVPNDASVRTGSEPTQVIP